MTNNTLTEATTSYFSFVTYMRNQTLKLAMIGISLCLCIIFMGSFGKNGGDVAIEWGNAYFI